MFFDSKKNNVILILDIGNGSVGGALVLLNQDEKPKICFSLREIFSFDEKPTGENLEKVVTKSLDVIISEILAKGFTDPYFKNNPKQIERISCVLSSPWFVSQGKTITIVQDKKFVITTDFIQSILDKEAALFDKEANGDSEQKSHRQIIERDLTSIKVNGYVLKNPIGQKVNNFETSLYISEANGLFIENILKTVSSHTHCDERDVSFHTFSSVAFSTISNLFIGIPDYLHFDVAGEITDITLVRAGMIKKTASYPSGTNLLIRRISERLSVPNKIARSFFHLYMDKRVEPNTKKQIEDAIVECQNEWSVYLNDALSSLVTFANTQGTSQEKMTEKSKEESLVGVHKNSLDGFLGASSTQLSLNDLPKKVFITAYPNAFELFNQFLHTKNIDEFLEWHKGINVTYIGVDLVSNFLTYNPLQPFDVFLGLEAVFFSKLIK